MKRRKRNLFNPDPSVATAEPGIKSAFRIWGDSHLETKFISISEHLKRTNTINERIKHTAEQAGINIIDPAKWICNRDKCSLTGPA